MGPRPTTRAETAARFAEGPAVSTRLTARQVDWIVVAGVAALSSFAAATAARHDATLAISLAALPLGAVPLLWRRSHPGHVLVAAAAAFALGAIVDHALVNLVALLVAVYSAARYGERPIRVAGSVIATCLLAVAVTAMLASADGRALGHLGGVAVGWGVAWVLGEQSRTRHAYLAELEHRASRLERERDLQARRAAEEERNRIAREIHDVVVHHVSVIAVQAGAARSTLPQDNQAALRPLVLIERTARTALSELRTLLGVLRRSDLSAPLRPQPTLTQLDELIGAARDAGVHPVVRVEGEVRPLRSMVDLCAYRVIQEALTNTIKHAPNANVHLLVQYDTRDLHITVVDDGPGLATPERTGHGLIGMRERAALIDGHIDAGPAPGGGFRVEAHLPLCDRDGDSRLRPSGQSVGQPPQLSTDWQPV
jgi:signal transduction histidine kinase